MDPKQKRAVALACDIVTLNYLKSHGFGSLASEFQVARNISKTVAGAFKTMTLEKISRFVAKKSQNQTPNNQDRYQLELPIVTETM
jgi:hypothetical protein